MSGIAEYGPGLLYTQPVIDKLTFFVAVARDRSFRRAAEACGVAQPTLSAGIKQLEDELGVMLIRRSSRYHGLTPEGVRVLDWARRLVGDAGAMRQSCRPCGPACLAISGSR